MDFSRTRAAVMHAGMSGFLYLNLRGRQPTGIVQPGEYESMRDELRERFLAETCTGPDGRTMQVFPEVHKPEELYGCGPGGSGMVAGPAAGAGAGAGGGAEDSGFVAG